mgnify:CR=1 FL=1
MDRGRIDIERIRAAKELDGEGTRAAEQFSIEGEGEAKPEAAGGE